MSAVRRHWALLLAVVLLVGAGVAFWQADRERGTDNVGNFAQVDDSTTESVVAAVSTALVRSFTFDYSNPDATEQAADEVLRGAARKEYDLLFEALRTKAPDQQLVLSAKVQVSAVQELEGDKARLLVFLDQASQRVTDKEASYYAAQLSIDAERIDGDWRVTGLRPL